MKNWGLRSLVALALAAGLCFTHASTITWKSGSSGNWSDKSNWNPNHVPGAGDTAVITVSGDYTVTLDVNASVGGLVLGAADGSTQTFLINGQTFTLAGQATVNSGGLINLSSGTFNGDTNSGGAVFSGTLAPSGGTLAGKLTIASNSVLNLNSISWLGGFAASNTFNGLILLTNYGTVTWSNMDFYCDVSLQIFNFGLWDAQANNTFYGNGMVFNNSGTFRKSAGGGTTTLDNNTAFNSSGTVDTESGTLAIQTGTCSGIFNAASGAILNFGCNSSLVTFTLTGNATFTGSGIVEGIEISGNNALIGGTVTFSAATLFDTMTISNTGVVNFVGTLGPNNFSIGTFNNYGTVNWGNTDLYFSGVFSTYNINNYGLWDAKANNTFHGTNPFYNSFNNYGTFRKSAGGGTTTLDSNLTFENTGTVDVQNGTLQIQNGYSPATGTFNIATNTFVYFSGTSGYGFLSYGSTSFTGNGSVLGNLTGASGGSNVINGTITYFGGTLSGSLMVASNAVLNLPVGANFSIPSYANLANYGTVNWISGILSGIGGCEIDNYGLWDAKTNNTFYGQSGLPTTFNNYGTFRKSGGSSYTNQTLLDANLNFKNYGTVDVQSGFLAISLGTGSGTFNTESNSEIAFLGNSPAYVLTGNPTFWGAGFTEGNLKCSNAVVNGTLTLSSVYLAGTLSIASNTVVSLVSSGPNSVPNWSVNFKSVLLTNYGTVNWNGTDLYGANEQIYNYGLWDAKTDSTFFGDGAVGNNGSPFYNYGTFRKSGGVGGQTLLDNNTTFYNYGTIDVQTGVLILGGGYTLMGGTLNFGINGPSDYGSISLAGIAPLAGKLSVNLNNNYSPGAGSSFALLGYGSETGTFTTTILPHLSGLIWQTNYGATVFTLSVTNVPSPQLSSTATQNGGIISLSWDGLGGQTYQFQCTTNLAPANWVNLGDVIPGTNGTMTTDDVISLDPQRFYRLVVLP